VVIVNRDEPPPTNMVNIFEFVAERESITVSVKLKVPLEVGVPEITPTEATFNPGGTWPLDVQLYGGVPPLTVNAWL
jgi:hypothetical protein